MRDSGVPWSTSKPASSVARSVVSSYRVERFVIDVIGGWGVSDSKEKGS